MPVDGANAKNVIPAADFLQLVSKGELNSLEGKRVALIGGGNVAMDAARTAVRLKAQSVHVFTRKRDDYTAVQEEITGAMQEGVRFRTLLSFLNIETDNETEEGRAQNRRIEISIILKDDSVMDIVDSYLDIEVPESVQSRARGTNAGN